VQVELHDQDGMTIVEVMVAMVILVVGVLGTLTMLEGSFSSTNRTTAREQGTNLARELVERSRQVPYKEVTATAAAAKLAATLPEAPVVTGSSFQVTRRNVVYSVTISACSIDDPSDGAGQGDATFCAAPTSTTGPGSATPGAAAAVNVLGIAVTAGGTLLDTVCNAVGTNTAILNTLTAAVSSVVPISACPGSSSTVACDSVPDDLRRVRVDVSWTRGGAGSVSQTTLLTNPNQTADPNQTPQTQCTA
jgi:prepilin-type N-terminal cleavage/methylation domain-containing protein